MAKSVIERFLEKVKITKDGCWLWQGALDSSGYGRFMKTGAHQFSYEYFVELIPEGLHVLHHCDTPPCVRPSHLYTGTRSDNMRDMIRRGRGKGQFQPTRNVKL